MVGYRSLLTLVAFAGLISSGCGGSTDTPGESTAGNGGGEHAEHEHAHADPKTLAEAVALMAEVRDELAEAFKSADVKAVDEAWHEMYPVAKKTKELAASSGLDRYEQDDAEEAATQIVEVLEELHPPHGADAKVDSATYDAQADSLNDAIANLKTIAEKVPTAQ
jgi:hypothetical protein